MQCKKARVISFYRLTRFNIHPWWAHALVSKTRPSVIKRKRRWVRDWSNSSCRFLVKICIVPWWRKEGFSRISNSIRSSFVVNGEKKEEMSKEVLLFSFLHFLFHVIIFYCISTQKIYVQKEKVIITDWNKNTNNQIIFCLHLFQVSVKESLLSIFS